VLPGDRFDGIPEADGMDDHDLEKHYAFKEAKAARAIMDSLVRVIKMHSMFPKSNPTRQQSLAWFQTNLARFLDTYGPLTLEIGKNHFLYNGDIIFKDGEASGEFAFLLYCDGLRWLEFQEGIEPWEVEGLIEIFHRYTRLSVDAEEDLVSALWDSNLPHIQFEAVNSILDVTAIDDPSLGGAAREEIARAGQRPEFNPFKSGTIQGGPPFDAPGSPQPFSSLLSEASAAHDLQSPLFPAVGYGVEDLSAEERAALRETVEREEELDPTEELLKTLVDILEHQEEKSLFTAVLEYIQEEVRKAFSISRFEVVIRIFKTLHNLRSQCGADRLWVSEQVDGLFHSLSSRDSLEVLMKGSADADRSQLRQIGECLEFLPPESIQALVPILMAVWSPQAREMLTEAIITLARRDVTPIERMLKQAGDNEIMVLIDLLAGVGGPRAVTILLGMIDHPSDAVPGQVIGALGRMKAWCPDRVFRLINRNSSVVRRTLLNYLGSRKCEQAEALLMNTISSPGFHKLEKGFALECFRTLGACGSSKALIFLRKMLVQGNRLGMCFKSVGRQGAAAGLLALGSKDAEQVLEEASRSPFPGVRQAVRSARMSASGERS